MKTKKTKDEIDEMPTTEQALREQLQQAAGARLRWRTVPLTALWQMVAAGDALVKRAPEAATEQVAEALTAVAQSCRLGEAVLAHNARIEAPALRTHKETVVKRASAIKAVVKLWARTGTAEVAAAAREVTRGLFPATELLGRLDHHAMWQAVAMKQVLLAEQPALAKALSLLLPAAQVTELFAANDALAAAMGHLGEGAAARLDEGLAARVVHERITRYQAAVLAGVKPADTEALRRAEQALQPIEALREQGARGRERVAKAKRDAAQAAAPQPARPAEAPLVDRPLPEGATD